MGKRRTNLAIIILGMLTIANGLFYLNNEKKQESDLQNFKDLQDAMIKEDTNSNKNNNEEPLAETDDLMQSTILNEIGTTIAERYNPPRGFERVLVEEESFGAFLRKQRLKPYGEKALYYNGKTKNPKGIYDSVLDIAIGDRDLHQCADAVMLLRAEYLYNLGKYDMISFNFTNGFKADYKKWAEGYRIQVHDNDVSWSKQASYDTQYNNFRKYMDMVFAYAGTMSLEKELVSKNSEEMAIGDVFIRGGSPGHAVIVVDMAMNEATKEKVFMLAQSYMPAQQTQILINPNEKEISPWYRLSGNERLITPQWEFKITELKEFQ
jgi:hypothetical protein